MDHSTAENLLLESDVELKILELDEAEEEKLLQLFESIEFLKQELKSSVVPQVKQCNATLKRDLREINDRIQKRRR